MTIDPAIFGTRGDRGYDHDAVEQFPWPVVVAYDDVHRWMDRGQAVHAVWQLRDAWECLIKFLGTLAVADFLALPTADEEASSRLLARLLKPLSLGDWATLMELSAKDRPPGNSRLSQLGSLLFRGSRAAPLFKLFTGSDESFVSWRNRRFGHGIFLKDEVVYAEEALAWLQKLHDAYDLCRDFFTSLTLHSDAPDGQPLCWGGQPPLPFYHPHQPAQVSQPLYSVRVRAGEAEPLELSPLLSVQTCGICGQWSVFYFDGYESKKTRTWFLDFVQGHSQSHKNLAVVSNWRERVREADAATVAKETQERREPNPDRFRNFVEDFHPPVWLARRIAAFVSTHDRGVIHLTGPAGVGKSWAGRGLGHAAMLPGVLGRAVPTLHVSLHGPAPLTAGDVVFQLRQQAQRDKHWVVPIEPDAPTRAVRFAAWLAALMQANTGELIVTIDGLDELSAESDVPELFPAADQLPERCYVVLASRPELRASAATGLQRAALASDHFQKLNIDADDPDHRAVLVDYARRQLARPRPGELEPLPVNWADGIVALAEGRFLYTAHYCSALRFGVYRDLSQLPRPHEFYPAFFAHLRARVGDDLFENYYARALACIAVARESIGVSHLTAFGLERTRLAVVLDDLADLLSGRRQPWDPETLYSLGHDAIRQFLDTDNPWQQRLREADHSLAQLAVQRFGRDWAAADPFDPVESYLVFHVLEHAQHEPELCEHLLADVTLSGACLTHGNRLYEQREYARALAAYDLALSIRDNQVDRQGRRELRPDLAGAYLNRGVALDGLGRLEEALDSYAACITLRETLVEREGRRELRPDLATAYMNRGVDLEGLGRLEEALDSYAACITLRETLVEREGRRELRPDLATAYMNRGVALADQGRLEEALDSYAACTTLYETLVECEGRRELRPDLATAYMNRGNALWSLGRLEEALDSYAACITFRETLVEREGRRELRPDLATAYMNRGVALADQGRLEDALDSYAACITLRETLVEREGRRELRPDLATAYMNRGVALADQGRLEDALDSYAACITLYETLVEREGRCELRPDLATAYMNRGVALWSLGRLEEALDSYAACITLYETLIESEGRRELAGDLGWAYAAQANCLRQAARRVEAAASAQKAVLLLRPEVIHTARADLKNVLTVAEQLLAALGAPVFVSPT